MNTKTKRNGMLDLMKFIFAALIIMHHSKIPTRFSPSYAYAVDFYFIVSGAMMAASAVRRNSGLPLGQDTLAFMKRKLSGLMPNWVLAWLLTLIIFAIQFKYSAEGILYYTTEALPELLLIQQGGTGITLTGYMWISWYLSSMLLSMFIIYPVMRKFKDTFFRIIAPLGVIFIQGYLARGFGGVGDWNAWTGVVYVGLLRGASEILLGCICFKLAEKLKKVKLTSLSKAILTPAEVLCYLFVIYFMFIPPQNHAFDFVVVVIALGLGVMLTLSQASYTARICRGSIFSWLGQLSLSMYLGHWWLQAFDFEGFDRHMAIILYFLLSMAGALVLMYLSKALKLFWKKKGEAIKRLFVKEAS